MHDYFIPQSERRRRKNDSDWAVDSTPAHEIEHLKKDIERHVEEDIFSSSEAKEANG